MATVTSFRDLLVWQKSMDLAEACYRISRDFPRDDLWVLGRELRKSCISVPSNIAEGYGRHSTAEYIHHLRFSNGSNNEIQTQIELARRAGVITAKEASTLTASAEEIGRMLHGLISSLERRR